MKVIKESKILNSPPLSFLIYFKFDLGMENNLYRRKKEEGTVSLTPPSGRRLDDA